ncbi:MAG: MMPL family transporter [Myxococcales bacterium]
MTHSPLASFAAAIRGLYGRFVAAVFARPRSAALIITLALVPGAILDAQYFANVRTSLEDLLPKDAPSVRALDTLHAKLGGQAHLTVIAQSDDPQTNRRFIDELGARLKARAPPEARSIEVRVTAERQWLLDHGALLMPRGDFDRLAGELETAIHDAKVAANPFNLDLDDGAAAERDQAWKKLGEEAKATAARYDRFPGGYFESQDGRTVVLLIWLQGSEVELGPAEHLMAAVKAEVAAIRGNYPPGLVVAYNGEVPNLIEEHQAILQDLSVSSLLVFVLVGLLIVLYFRSIRSVIAVAISLVPGLVASFAVGRLTVGSLNSNSAFLGSIIAGNGINYPIIFLAYYRARPPSETRVLAVRDAAVQALPGTLGAALTASAAYGALATATFRGFSEFGWIGGIGMVLTWLLSFLTLPVAIALLDPPRRQREGTPLSDRIEAFFARPWAPRLAAGAFLALALSGTALGLWRGWREGYYERDILALRNRESVRSGSASWDKKVGELFGIWLNPVVALAPDPAQRQEVAARLREGLTTGQPAPAERIETIDEYAPPAAEQAARLARLQKLAGAVRELPEADIPKDARPVVKAWFDPANLRPIAPAEVPYPLRQAFTEHDGRTDRVVLIFPSLKINYNDTQNLMTFVDRLEHVSLPAGTVVGGAFLFMAEIIRLVRHESTNVVLVVCLLVSAALVPIFLRRPSRIAKSVGTVALVAICAQSIMLALGVHINMFNFAAVPVTIGVGADYVVNLLGAMDAFGVDARGACARMGGAILLCSLTTVVGYLSLVFAQSGALRTFGWAAVLGELMAVTTVLLVVPALSRERPAHATNLLTPFPELSREAGEGAKRTTA